MVIFLIEENKKYYDIETMRMFLRVPKAKIQRELKKRNVEIVKYKNLHIYKESSFFELMELILIEKLSKTNG